MKKKIVRCCCLILLFACFCQQIAFASWSSISKYNQFNPSDWAKEAVCNLEYYGIIKRNYSADFEYADMEVFRRNIRRDNVAHLIVNLFELHIGAELPLPENYPFERLPPAYENSVKKAYGAGLMNGRSDTKFGAEPITRQELAVVLYRAAKAMDCFKGDAETFSNDEEIIADWALSAVSYVYNNGIMLGTSDSKFSPEDFATREMAYTCLHRFAVTHGIYESLSEDYISSVEFTPAMPIKGDLDALFAAADDKERQVISKALELFPNAFQIHVYSKDLENKSPYGIRIYANEGDFALTLSENGISSSLRLYNNQYDKYEDFVYSVIDLSTYEDIFLEKYENARQQARDNESLRYSYTESHFISDRVAEGTCVYLSIEYDAPYDEIYIVIDDVFNG